MESRLKYLIGIFLLFLVGCGPRYVIRNRYEPPPFTEARKCLSRCEQELKHCQSQCLAQRQKCLVQANNQVAKLYPQLLATYSADLRVYEQKFARYQAELMAWETRFKRLYEDYRYFKGICHKEKDPYACKRQKELHQTLNDLEHHRPYRPAKPQKPDLARLLKNFRSTCMFKCNCQQIYDACFVKCGGSIIPERICIDHCK